MENVYPEVQALKAKSDRMRAALCAILAPRYGTPEQTDADVETHDAIYAAQWYSDVEGVNDLAHFIKQAGGALGIDQVVTAAGYPDDVIEALANTIAEHTEAMEDLTFYSANCCYDTGELQDSDPRVKHSKIVFADDLPVGADGTSPIGLRNCFRDCTSLLGVAPVLHWDNVTRCDYAFNGSSVLPFNEVEIHIASCTDVSYFGGNFRSIALVGARSISVFSRFAYDNVFLQEFSGLNMANISSATYPLPRTTIVLKTIEFDGLTIDANGNATWDGGNDYKCDANDSNAVNYIQSGMALGKSATTVCQIASQTVLDEATLLALVYMAYDWETDPLFLGQANRPAAAMLTYDFTQAQKSALASAYPNINAEQIMTDKGWTY